MARVRVTKQARKDLDAIVAYYEQVNSPFAFVFEESVVARVRQLERFPRMGRMVPELGQESMREILYRGYRIVYHVDDADEEVGVLTIFHSSRPLGAMGPGGET